jgi:hypothetical protein
MNFWLRQLNQNAIYKSTKNLQLRKPANYKRIPKPEYSQDEIRLLYATTTISLWKPTNNKRWRKLYFVEVREP